MRKSTKYSTEYTYIRKAFQKKKSKYELLVNTSINNIMIISYYKVIINNELRRRSYFKCQCHCGKIFATRCCNIANGNIKSCGCFAAIKRILPNNQAALNDTYRGYKSSAAHRNVDFSLTKSEFEGLIFKDCFYCGAPPSMRTWKASKKIPYFLCCNGIDRVNSNLGYFINNCVPCCSSCNFAKSDLSLDEFRKWANQMIIFNTPKILW